MDLTRFEPIVRDPRRTRVDIETMRRHALDKGEIECVALATEVLSARFPATTKRVGGATPTTARFLAETREFGSGKAAYLWLIAKFSAHCSDALDRYVGLHRRASSHSNGCRFARNPLDLFPLGSRRRGDPAHYAKLESGWFADTNLNHYDKFAALMQISFGSNLEYTKHWDFRVTGETAKLRDHQKAVLRARVLLDELLRL
jgi:hypothetical protein